MKNLRLLASSLSVSGLIFALLLCFLAFQPSLLPRGPVSQAVLGAIFILAGYGLGFLLEKLFKRIVKKPLKRLKLPEYLALVVWLIGVFIITIVGAHWQTDQIRQLGLQVSAPQPVIVFCGLLIILGLLLLVGYAVFKFVHFITHVLHRFLGRALAFSAAILLTLGLIYLELSYAVLRLEQNLEKSQRVVQTNLSPPSSSLSSGSQDSLVSWDKLGLKGREFVSSSVELSRLKAFWPDQEVKEPIRAYVGIDNEPDIKKRAQLLVQELDRTGAFSRSAIVLFTPSGTGWVNEVAVETGEYIFKGDVASASIQYSAISSFLQFIVDQKIAGQVSNEMFNAVRDKLNTLAADQRPKLYIYGESLGSLGSQARFVSTETNQFSSLLDGALWVGSPSASGLTTRFNRGEQSAFVRFGNSGDDMISQNEEWASPRVAFLYNNTDPIVRINKKLIYAKPDWLKKPGASDISQNITWLPVITSAQLTFEVLKASSQPSGVGHNYKAKIPDAWVAVIQPNDWNEQKTELLTKSVTGEE